MAMNSTLPDNLVPELKDVAARVVELCRQAGADEAEVLVRDGSELTVKVRMGQPELVYRFMDLASQHSIWNSRVGAATLALVHGRSQSVQNFAVEFVEGRFDGANTVALLTAPRNESRGECACACACIKQAHCSRKRSKH